MTEDYKTPVAAPPDWRELCEELAGWIERSTRHYIQDPDVLIRAYAALAEPEPEAVGPTDEELLRMAAEAIDPYDTIGIGEYEAETECAVEAYGSELIAFARAVLARWGHHFPDATKMVSSAPPPAEGEVGELVAWLREQADNERGCEFDECEGAVFDAADKLTRAADLIEQRHPAPVPVAEHPWKRDRWCDDEDRCWCFNQWDLQWELENYTTGAHWCDWMLPATALPMPAGEVE